MNTTPCPVWVSDWCNCHPRSGSFVRRSFISRPWQSPVFLEGPRLPRLSVAVFSVITGSAAPLSTPHVIFLRQEFSFAKFDLRRPSRPRHVATDQVSLQKGGLAVRDPPPPLLGGRPGLPATRRKHCVTTFRPPALTTETPTWWPPADASWPLSTLTPPGTQEDPVTTSSSCSVCAMDTP